MANKQSFVIRGLAGERKLNGIIRVNGAKNAALKAMAAAVLFDGPVILNNIPDTDDIHTLKMIIEKLGAKISVKKASGNGLQSKGLQLTIDASGAQSSDIDSDLAKTMRGSVVLTGPLLGRFGRVTFPAPGGCVIGSRPIDLFVKGYEKMGAGTVEKDCSYVITSKHGITGAEIFFDKISVGATETLMMAAVLAKGRTILKNCAMEPEIVNVAEWLIACGAKIIGVGTPTIEIQGTGGKLLSPKAEYTAIPDRIEAGSFILLGALSAHELDVVDCEPRHMEALLQLLSGAGVNLVVGKSNVKVLAPKDGLAYKSFNLMTHEYPGFPTDLQAQAVAFLTQCSGESVVLETIFEGRFKYVADLTKMGATITEMNPREILVKGATPLFALPNSEELAAHDIRAGFAMVMAAIVSKGELRINNVHLIDRGYANLEERLVAVGVSIKRVAA